MEQTDNYNRSKAVTNYVTIAKGLLFLVLGTAVLLRKIPSTQFLMPDWLYGIHSLVILIGFYKGVKSNFSTSAWLLIIMLGIVIYLLRVDYIDVNQALIYGLPAFLIVAGTYLILKK